MSFSDLKNLVKLKKKFPAIIKLGTFDQQWIDDVLEIYETSADTSDELIAKRTSDGKSFFKSDDYIVSDELKSTYEQRSILSDVDLSPAIGLLSEYMNNTRFATLLPGGELPMHIDTPFNHYRMNIVVKGSHTFFTDGMQYEMKAGEAYFINSGYEHGVVNNTDTTRIAILGDVDINERTTAELLRTRA